MRQGEKHRKGLPPCVAQLSIGANFLTKSALAAIAVDELRALSA
jgi:hypothetical protein